MASVRRWKVSEGEPERGVRNAAEEDIGTVWSQIAGHVTLAPQ